MTSPNLFPTLGDVPMSKIYGHLPNIRATDRDVKNHLTCRPTPLRYRVLGDPEEPCPLEARLNEPDNSLCCTSKLGDQNTHPESLAYLRILNSVFRRIPPQNRVRIPVGFQRVMKWIMNRMSNPEITNPGVNGNIRLDTQHPQFFQLVKLVLMTESAVQIMAHENNNNDLDIVNHGTSIKFHGELGSVNAGLLRVANEVGVQNASFVPVPFTPGTPITPIYPVRANNMRVFNFANYNVMNNVSRAPINLAEVVSYVETANNMGWPLRTLHAEQPAVVGMNTSTMAQCLRLVQAFKYIRANTSQSVRIHVGNPQVNVPGYSAINFNPNDMHAFVTTLADSVHGTGLQARPHNSYSFIVSQGERKIYMGVNYWQEYDDLYFRVVKE